MAEAQGREESKGQSTAHINHALSSQTENAAQIKLAHCSQVLHFNLRPGASANLDGC